jgi:hypothetical protein
MPWLTHQTRRAATSCQSKTGLIETSQPLRRKTGRKLTGGNKKSSTPGGKFFAFLIFRVQKYERDLKRWEYMEEEQDRQNHRINAMKDKYQIGNANKGGAAYNILSLDYENSKEGEALKKRD